MNKEQNTSAETVGSSDGLGGVVMVWLFRFVATQDGSGKTSHATRDCGEERQAAGNANRLPPVGSTLWLACIFQSLTILKSVTFF